MREPERARRGGRIPAEAFTSLWELLRSLGLRVTYPLRLVQSGANVILTAEDTGTAPVLWAKTTGGAEAGATYPWIERIRKSDHTWIDGPRGSSIGDDGALLDPLYEVNANMTIPVGTTCEAWVDARTRDFVTQTETCA